MPKDQEDTTCSNKPPDPSPHLLSPVHLCFSYFVHGPFLSLLHSGYFLPHPPLYSLWNVFVGDIIKFCLMYRFQSLSSLLTTAFILKSILLHLTCKTFCNLSPIFFPNLTCALVPLVLSSNAISSHWVPLYSCLQVVNSCYFFLSFLFLFLRHWCTHLCSHEELLICLLKCLSLSVPGISYLCL